MSACYGDISALPAVLPNAHFAAAVAQAAAAVRDSPLRVVIEHTSLAQALLCRVALPP